MPSNSLPADQLHRIDHSTLRVIHGAAPNASVIGCDAYEMEAPFIGGAFPCSAKPVIFAYALYRAQVVSAGATEETYALVGLCKTHARAGHLLVRRYPAKPMTRPKVLDAWRAATGVVIAAPE
jgi:hypothetical protein